MAESIIYHIDINSAFLSWQACYDRQQSAASVDIREIPAVIGGSEEKRHGVVLAKSIPAKRFGIHTGEPLIDARRKCPELLVVPPNYPLYVNYSNRFIELLKKYAPIVEQYSIDEAFCDMSGTRSLYGDPVAFAHKLREEIRDTLGFTVNIGVSSNKLLAKMASDFQKPDRVHTLFPEEIAEKMWPLPVGDLFFVGRATARKLHTLGIHTIGQLAGTDPAILCAHLKKHGNVIWNFANGRDLDFPSSHDADNKSFGNSITISYDVTDRDTAKMILLSLCETVGSRIRADGSYIGMVSVSILNHEFKSASRQTILDSHTDITERIYDAACLLFDSLWDQTPIRQLGVSTGKATKTAAIQCDLFDEGKNERLQKLNTAIDSIRSQYGQDSVMRACFLNSDQEHMTGGLAKEKQRQASEKSSDASH